MVAPALARPGWAREFRAWWPERFAEADRVAVVDMTPTRKTQSKKRRATWEEVLARPVRVISPELLNIQRDRAWLGKRGAIVLDEVHMYTDPAAARSVKLKRFTLGHFGPVFGLTATPIPNRPDGFWNVCDTVFPRRLGVGAPGKVGYEYLIRYVERIWNGYGHDLGGLRVEMAEELQYRLRWMMSRTTRAEVAHLLPVCQIVPLAVDERVKVAEVVDEWVAGALEEVPHVVVLTHLRKTAKVHAERLAAALSGIPVVHTDGADLPTARDAKLEALREQPRGVLVATMHSVARSISLSWCRRGLLAELYWSPERLVQVSGRFARLDGTGETVLNVLCQGGSVQERMANAVAEKLWDNAQVLQQGEAEGQLSAALQPDMEQALLDAAYCVASEAELELLSSMSEDEEE